MLRKFVSTSHEGLVKSIVKQRVEELIESLNRKLFRLLKNKRWLPKTEDILLEIKMNIEGRKGQTFSETGTG